MTTKREIIDQAAIRWANKIAYSLFMLAIFVAMGYALVFIGFVVPVLGLLLHFFVMPAYVVCAVFCIILPLVPNRVFDAIGNGGRR